MAITLNQSNLTDRASIFAEVRRLLAQPDFSKESASRVEGMLQLADRLKESAPSASKPETREGLRILAFERRDINTSSGQWFVPALFEDELTKALRMTDGLFDEENCFSIRTKDGAKIRVPILVDTECAAVEVTEGGTGSTQTPNTLSVEFPSCPTYRTLPVPVSLELAQDSGYPLDQVMAEAFSVRYSRGAGPDLVSALLSGATLGATAASASTICFADICATKLALDPAYRQDAIWAMNANTLGLIESLVSTTGQPIFPKLGDGKLLGLKWIVCPSMPDPSAESTPLVLYSKRMWVVRRVWPAMFATLKERYAITGQIAFQGFLRIQGALAQPGGSGSPPAGTPSAAVYLQMKSS
jgi:HK97 family phage major capsid protein